LGVFRGAVWVIIGLNFQTEGRLCQMEKEFEPKFVPDNPLTKNPQRPGDERKRFIPKEDTHAGIGLQKLDGIAEEIDGIDLLGEDE